MEINGLNSDKFWDYENAFYWFSPKSRIAKHIAHWEIYKQTIADMQHEIHTLQLRVKELNDAVLQLQERKNG